MSRPVSDTIHEAQVAGKLIRGIGPIITLSISVLVLTAALAFSMITAKVGGDRWTASNHDDYVVQHDRDKDTLVGNLLTEHAAVHKEEAVEDKKVSEKVSEIHTDVAVLKSTVSRMESDLKIIKTAVINMERNGGGG